MIAQKTTEFLIENFPDKKNELFDDKYTQELYEYLKKFVDNNNELIEKKSEIREAFVDFFKDRGNVSVVFKGLEKIVVRVRPFVRNIDKKKLVDKVILVLDMEKESVLKNAPRSDLIAISDELFLRLNHQINEENPNVDKKSILKEAVTRSFSLSKKDVVVQLKGKLFIRLFKGGKKQEEEGREKRFNGLPPEELAKMKRDLFPEGITKDLGEIADLITANGIDFAKINNHFFEKNHIQIIQKSLKQFFSKKINFEKYLLEGFVNFVFRENFELIHKELAKRLIKLFYQQIGVSDMFVKYYNGDITVYEGNKYRSPMIVDEQGGEWKPPVIKTIAKQRFLNEQKRQEKIEVIKKSEKSLVKAKAELAKKAKKLQEYKSEHESSHKDLEASTMEINKKRQELLSLRKSLKKSSQKKETEEKIKKTSLEIKELTKEEGEHFKKRAKLEKEINTLEHQVITTKQDTVAIEKKIKEDGEKVDKFVRGVKDVEDKYEILIDAMTKALLKKKKKV